MSVFIEVVVGGCGGGVLRIEGMQKGRDCVVDVLFFVHRGCGVAGAAVGAVVGAVVELFLLVKDAKASR